LVLAGDVFAERLHRVDERDLGLAVTADLGMEADFDGRRELGEGGSN